MTVFVSALLGSLLPMAVLVLATLGITLIFKTSFTTNFAQGSIAVFSGYVAAVLVSRAGFHIAAAVPFALVAGFAVAIVVDVVFFRLGRNVNALGKQIITMGLIIIIVSVMPLIFGATEIVVDMRFFEQIYTVKAGEYEIIFNMNHIFCFAVAAVVVAGIFILLKFSKWGLSVRATASNELVAQMMGINTKVVTALTWGIAGMLGGLAAIMQLGAVSPTLWFMVGTQVDAFMAGILGGMNSFFGPVVGAVLIPFLRFLLKYYVSFWADVLLYGIILLVVLIRPNGLFGKKIVIKV